MLQRQSNPIGLTLALLLIASPVIADPPESKRQRASQRTGPRANQQAGQYDARQNVDNQGIVINVDGKLKGFEQGLLIVTRDDGSEVLVKPPEDVHQFQFVAEASARFLQQGMLVRFNGSFNKAGVAQSPISNVELFQPINGKMPGNIRKQYSPGVYVDPADARNPSGNGIAKCDVVGTLMGIDSSGVMSVRAGKVPVQIPLVQNAKFKIRYNNLALAKPGDEISVSGFYNPPDETKIVAQTVTVTTDRVYGEFVEEEAEKPSKKRRTRRRSRKTEQEPESASDDAPEGGTDTDSEATDEEPAA